MVNKELNSVLNFKIDIVWHISFWLFFLFYQAFIFGLGEERSFFNELRWAALDLPVQIITTYFTIFFLIPRYFVAKKFRMFVLTFFLTLFLASFINRALYYFFYNPILNVSVTEDFLNLPKTLKMIFALYPVVVLGSLIKIGQLWHEREQINQTLKNEKLETELKLLKAQVNPHFLFNTLNSLYALTLKKSEKASEVVERLSFILEYLLYEGNKTNSPLDKELELLNNYINLEKIRYGDRLSISFNCEGDVRGKKIPSLLLLPFVENAFKHGVSEQLESAYIQIHFKVGSVKLNFQVINSQRKDFNSSVKVKPRGIGLCNVRKRLDLLFKKDYSLQITDNDDKFHIDLTLPMTYSC